MAFWICFKCQPFCLGASIYNVRSRWGEGGSQKSRRKEPNQLICDSDKGRGSKNPKILRTSYMEAPLLNRVHARALSLPRMHYLIAPYLLGNHFQTREGDCRERGGNPSPSSGDFSFSMRVCGDAENGPNVRGESGGSRHPCSKE